MRDQVWSYISNRYHDGVLPHGDDIYTAFDVQFDNGWNFDEVDEIIDSFVSCSDMDGIDIQWEGDLSGICDKGIRKIA